MNTLSFLKKSFKIQHIVVSSDKSDPIKVYFSNEILPAYITIHQLGELFEHYLSFGGVNKNFIKLEHNGIIIYIATGESKTVFGNIRNINKIIVTPVIQRAEVVYTDGDVRKTSILKYEQFVEQMKLVGGIKTYFSLSSEVYGEYVYTKI